MFEKTDIKILYDIVVRADELLPTLPDTYRRPIPALLKAYNEVLPEYGIRPEDDHQITKLVFKVGGVFGRGTLMEKFRAALSRMNITLELDVPQLLPGNASAAYAESYSTSDDNSESRGAPSHPTSGEDGEDGYDGYPSTDNGQDEYSNAGETNEYTIPKDDYSPLDDDDSYTIPRSEGDVDFEPEPVRKVPHSTMDIDAIQARIEQNLEQSAIAFHERYHTKFTVAAALRRWRRCSQSLNQRWLRYREAVESDMIGELEDTFHAWRIVAAEAEEVPPPDLPSNIYSKRTEQIAARTYQIFAAKNAFTRWRRLAKEQRRRRQHQAEAEAEAVAEPPDPMERLAIKAHENLVLSRTFVRWSNRSAQELRKARMAAKVYELSLKSKTFGHRHRPDDTLFDTTLAEPEPPMVSAGDPAGPEDDEMFDDDYESAEMQRKAEMARKGFLMRSLAKRADEAANTDREAAGDNGGDDPHAVRRPAQPTHKPPTSLPIRLRTPAERSEAVKSIKDKIAAMASGARRYSPVPPQERLEEQAEDEADERTLLARRHILRIRFFNAWESYTLKHTTKAKKFAMSKTIDPWRERVFELHDIEYECVRDREDRLLRGAINAWVLRTNEAQSLEEKAGQVQRQLRVEYTMKPWIAASREKRRSLQQRNQAFETWFEHEDNEAILAIVADEARYFQRTRRVLKQWRAAKDNRIAKRSVFKTYSERAGYYYNVTDALRVWKASARQAATRKSMQVEALATWRNASRKLSPREDEMKTLAEDINFSHSASRTLPVWRAGAAQAAQARGRQSTYADKADYYYKTKGTLGAWRARAEARRKENIKKAHSEARRRIKRAAGERCVARWRAALPSRAADLETLASTAADLAADRAWAHASDALEAWRGAAALADVAAETEAERTRTRAWDVLDAWRGAADERARRAADAATLLRRDRAAARALRAWNLAALQRAARGHAVANRVREKRDRRLLRRAFEEWRDAGPGAGVAAGGSVGVATVDGGGIDWLDFVDDDDGAGVGVGVGVGGGDEDADAEDDDFDDEYARSPSKSRGPGPGRLRPTPRRHPLSQSLSQSQSQSQTQTPARGPLLHSWHHAQEGFLRDSTNGKVKGKGKVGGGNGGGSASLTEQALQARMSANARAFGANENLDLFSSAGTAVPSFSNTNPNLNSSLGLNPNPQPQPQQHQQHHQEDVYVPTPGRPRLALFGGSGGSAASTTPLAPVPNRGGGGGAGAAWKSAGVGAGAVGRGSVLRNTTSDARARAAGDGGGGGGRSRRNLRVSWAE